VLGMMTSSFPGVMFGPLHYRSLDMDKTNALKQSKGNFEGKMSMSQESITEVKWWITSLPEAYNPINHGEVEVTISTDASLTGWGACIDTTTTGGSWTPDERANDINYLEILAVFLALQSFSSAVAGKHVKLLVDNTTAVFSINNMGTCHSKANNTLVAKIWEWCIINNTWLTVAHIPGKQNTAADRESRASRRETEWSLNKDIFNAVVSKLGFSPNIDLFASRLNYQVKPYVAYTPDPEAYAIDAFHLSWRMYKFYAFPPFCIIHQVLQKVKKDQATGLLIVPYWPTQAWWPYLMNMLIQYPVILPRRQNTLILQADPQAIHPLFNKLELLCCHLSGVTSSTEGISEGASEIIMQSWRQGTQKQYRTYLQRWEMFCGSRGINPVCATVGNGIEFLFTEYQRGLSYSALNTIRSALSTVIFPTDQSFGSHPLVTRFLKGVFESRPSLPRYQATF
jgi:hypothetical protein